MIPVSIYTMSITLIFNLSLLSSLEKERGLFNSLHLMILCDKFGLNRLCGSKRRLLNSSIVAFN